MDKQEFLEMLKDEEVQNAVGNAVLSAIKNSPFAEYFHFSSSILPRQRRNVETQFQRVFGQRPLPQDKP